MLEFVCHTSLQHIFLFSCATHSAPTYHYEAPLFLLQLIEKGLSKIRRQSELIKVSRWHLSIAITANLFRLCWYWKCELIAQSYPIIFHNNVFSSCFFFPQACSNRNPVAGANELECRFWFNHQAWCITRFSTRRPSRQRLLASFPGWKWKISQQICDTFTVQSESSIINRPPNLKGQFMRPWGLLGFVLSAVSIGENPPQLLLQSRDGCETGGSFLERCWWARQVELSSY